MSHEPLNREVVEIVRNWDDLAKRFHYERRLHELGPTAVATLLVLVREEVLARRKRRRFGWFLIALSFSTVPLKMALFGPNPGLIADLLIFPIRYGCLYAGLGCFFRNKSRAATVLADFDDMRIVGPLVESWNALESRPAITDALLRFLPRMKASEAYLLNSEQRKALYRILKSKEETLVLAILKALEQIGDGVAFPFVEKLAHPPSGAEFNPKSARGGSSVFTVSHGAS